MNDEFKLDTYTSESGALVLRVMGELDMATADQLPQAIVDWPTAVSECIVDLSACSFVDSSGIRALLLSQRELEDGGTLRLIGVMPYVERTLRIAGVQEVLQIESPDD